MSRGCCSHRGELEKVGGGENLLLLMGNPNVGKSVVFSRLTGARVISSNYPGTTVEFSQGHMRVGGRKWLVVDAPGTYSLEPTSGAEKVAVELLGRVGKGDVVAVVMDATNLERNLFLCLQILRLGLPTVVMLNMWDEAKIKGIEIDVGLLEDALGVPVVPTVALTGEGFSTFTKRLSEARSGRDVPDDEAIWSLIGEVVKRVQHVSHRHPSPWEILGEATVKPLTGIPFAILVLFFLFMFIRIVGEGLISLVFDPLFEAYTPVAMGISRALGGSGFLHSIVIGQLVDGEIDYFESMGVLTTGIYIPIAAVFPYVLAFYISLSFLEDVGYLPRLAVLVDNIFHRIGLHGYGIVPILLGLGCNVPGAMASRVLETRKQRFLAMTLIAIAVPCTAQMAMIFGILGGYGIRYVVMVFVSLFVVYILMGLLLNRIVKGESPEIFIEIPPYRRPAAGTMLKKTWMRVSGFLRDALPFVLLGVLLVNILYTLGVIDVLGRVFSPVVSSLWGLDPDATGALLIGFLRKDVAVGMLLPLGMNPLQLTIAATVLTLYFPCVATFLVMLKEMGWRDLLKSTGIMVATALVVGFLMRLILLGV